MEKYFVIVLLLFSELDAIILEKCWRATSAKENGDDSMEACLREMGGILEGEWSRAFE